MRRISWLMVLLLASLTPGSQTRLQADERPSVLLILADDLAFDAVHDRNPEVQTPHLDQLFRSGTTFSHCYNMGGWNGAICIASRTMLNSGRALWKAPQKKAEVQALVQQRQFLSQMLHDSGYFTCMTGKWHLPVPPDKVFDAVKNPRGGMPHDSEQYGRPVPGVQETWSPSDPKFGGYWTGGKHWSEVTADDAVEFVHQASHRSVPTFFYVAFNAPHDPRQSPAEYVARYPRQNVTVPRDFLPDYPYRDAMGLTNLRDENLAPHPRTPEAVQTHRSEYYALITHLDDQIGRILKSLDETGLREKTIICFTADHGLSIGHRGLLGKQNLYDPSVRVPFVISGPGIAAGTVRDEPIYLQDIMPTFLDIAGVSVPQSVDFRSLWPVLHGQAGPARQAIYGAYTTTQRMIRTDRYKLILYPLAQRARLFDLQADPDEMHDLLAGENPPPAARDQAALLFEKLLKLQHETGDTLDLPAAFPQFK